MTINGYQVIDADGHVFETARMYELFRDQYLPRKHADALGDLMRRAREKYKTQNITTPHLWAVEGKVPMVGRGRALGTNDSGIDYPNQGTKEGTEALRDPLDPKGRLRDMDRMGIDVMVIYPSSTASFCALQDKELEAALYQAYNRWCADHCAIDPQRLKYVGVVPLRDPEAGVAEAYRAAKDASMVAVYCMTHIEDKQLDQPYFDPIWRAAQDQDLSVAIHHTSAALPPYGIGMFEMNECWFEMHAASNPFEQMRAIATMIGGGVFERHPKLRVAFLEAGCGWLPYWLDRLDEHHEMMPYSVPLMKKTATEVFATGRAFVSFEVEERMLPAAIKHVGDDVIVFASDYPHFDGKFPDAAHYVAARKDLTKANKRKLFSDNAKRLYPRIA